MKKYPKTVGELSDERLYTLSRTWSWTWISQMPQDPLVDGDDLAQEIAIMLLRERSVHPLRSVSSVGWMARSEVRVVGSRGKRGTRIDSQVESDPAWASATPQERERIRYAARRREKTRVRPATETPLEADTPAPRQVVEDEALEMLSLAELVDAIHSEIGRHGMPRDHRVREHSHQLLDTWAGQIAAGETPQFASEVLPPGSAPRARRLLRCAARTVAAVHDISSLPSSLRVPVAELLGQQEPDDDEWLAATA